MGFAGMAARLTGAGAGPEVLGTAKNPLVTMQVSAVKQRACKAWLSRSCSSIS